MENKSYKCKVAKKCSGCQLSNLDYEQQLKYKQNKVNKCMIGICKPEKIIGMENPYHYRNKAQAAFKMGREKKLVSGVYQSVNNTVVEIDNCFLQTKLSNEILKTLCKLFKSFKVLPYDAKTDRGFLRSVLIRQGFATGEVMVVLIGATAVFPAKKTFVSALVAAHPEIKTIVLSQNTNTSKLFTGNKFKVIYGDGKITDVLCGLKFEISPKSFYQINPLQTEILYNKAVEFANLDKSMTVLDAYCGIGTVGLVAAKHVKKVYGVEVVADAVNDAKKNAVKNNIKNAEFYVADAKDFIKEIEQENIKIDVALIDPPRMGCSKEFISSLNTITPQKIVYISCNAETQARDIRLLMQSGYTVTKCQPIDMFPHTNHVETVILMSRVEK